MSGSRTLKTVVFVGSARNQKAFWGGDERLGTRVVNHVVKVLQERKRDYGGEQVDHDVHVLDPAKLFAESGDLAGSGQLSMPHFFYEKGKAPKKLDAVAKLIKSADCYVVVTPEYNHSIPPALSSLMGHFGGSNYSLKTSAIVTYSPGPWGGMRAAMALRPMLSELGCLPVSKLAAFPAPGDMFEENGDPKDPQHRMLKQLPAMLNELEWTTLAFQNMKAEVPDPQAN